MIIPILIAALVIMAASLGGVLFAWKGLNHFFTNHTTLLTSFATGVFAVVSFSLFQEAAHEGLALPMLFLWGLTGAVFLHMIGHIIPEAHHHHEISHDGHEHTRLDARRLLVGDAIHNIGDGIILVPAFLVDVRFGIATTIGIFLHELTQEIAEFFILKRAGYSTRRALIYNFLVSSTILVGVGLSLNFAFSGESLAIIFAIAGGGFLYVIVRDLLPDVAHVMHCSKRFVIYPLFIFLGTATMLSVNIFVPHAHDAASVEMHASDHDHDDDHLDDEVIH